VPVRQTVLDFLIQQRGAKGEYAIWSPGRQSHRVLLPCVCVKAIPVVVLMGGELAMAIASALYATMKPDVR